jgi:hypothetical protein
MTVTNVNGARKSLAEQIDRLDGILDGMAEGLQGAVADAVRQAVSAAVQEAVRGVLAELLTNPDLLALLRGPLAPPTQAKEQPGTEAHPRPTVRQRLARVKACVGGQLRALGGACRAAATGVCRSAVSGCARLAVARRFKGPLLASAGVGVLAGVAAYYAGPWLAALASGAGGFAAALAVQAGLWLRRLLAGAALPGA